jgi:hypothetical protein
MGQKQTYAAQQVMSALPPTTTAKADFRTRSCASSESEHVRCNQGGPLWARSGHRGRLRPFREQSGRAWQNHPDFGEFAGLRIDLNRPATMS